MSWCSKSVGMMSSNDFLSTLFRARLFENLRLIPNAPSVPMQSKTTCIHYIIAITSLPLHHQILYTVNVIHSYMYVCVYVCVWFWCFHTAIPEDMIQEPEPTEDDPEERIPRELCCLLSLRYVQLWCVAYTVLSNGNLTNTSVGYARATRGTNVRVKSVCICVCTYIV